MSTTQTSNERETQIPTAATVETKLEVVVLPVSDVERAKRFYMSLGWRLDADFTTGDDWRAVQLTPPGSPCSVIFGKGFTAAVPGSLQGTFLVVDDVKAARAELLGRGVDVSEVFHFEGVLNVIGTNGRAPGPDPEGRSYRSWASFSDPTATAGCSRRSRRGFPDEGSASTSRR